MDLQFSISAPSQALDEPVDRPALAAWIVWASVVLIALGIVALILAAPWAQASGHPAFAAAVYRTFSYVCHQIPERSFHLAGHKFGVCSRCTGLYSGLALAALAYPVTRSLKDTTTPRLFWLFLAAVPLAVDFSLGYFSIWQNTHLSRFVTGTLLGGVAIFYIIPGLIEIGFSIQRRWGRNN